MMSAEAAAADGAAAASGGYNFRRIMDDHFEHYKRPPSREPSVDKMPATLAEARAAAAAAGNPAAAASAVRSSRASSRTRTPLRTLIQTSASKTDIHLDSKAAADATTAAAVRDDSKTNGGPPSIFNAAQAAAAAPNLKYRGPSQTVDNIGAIPKRTESMYFKPFEDSEVQHTGKEGVSNGGGGGLQRKKSLPDVQNLVVVTKSQGSKQMTREEISVLSASRRETMRKQIEEIERYKANPILYIINPRVKDWFYRQRLMIFIMFLNLSLAFMFFKLLT